MCISDWRSDVCSSDLVHYRAGGRIDADNRQQRLLEGARSCGLHCSTMAFESKTIEHLARYLVSGSNGFGACELVQLRTGIAGSHAWAVWMIIAIIDGKLDRRAERQSDRKSTRLNSSH